MEAKVQVSQAHRLWQGFWQLADHKIWVASTVPILVAAAYVYSSTGSLHFGWLFAALGCIYLIEIGKNAVNEFVDYYTGVDRFVAPDKRTPFSGGKKTIVDGKLSMLETAIIAVVTLGIAFCLGVLVAFVREPNIFWVGLAGGVIAVAYSLPPIKLAYRGLGEIAVGLAFGPLMTAGAYLILTQSFDWNAVLIGVPTGILIANVLWINQYPDYEADVQGRKRNGVVRIGRERGVRVYAALYIAAYASLAVLAIVMRNPFWLLGLLSLPLALQAIRIAKAHYADIPRLMPANAKTVQIYQLIGLAMIIATFLKF